MPGMFTNWLNSYVREARELRETAETVAHEGQTDGGTLPRTIDVRLTPPCNCMGVTIRELVFHTPAQEILHLLPLESHQCRALVVSPQGVTEPWEWGPTVLSLPGTGDHGFRRRFANLGLPLALASGITTIIPESPFYGVRKPPG